jgi:hypothetical protein
MFHMLHNCKLTRSVDTKMHMLPNQYQQCDIPPSVHSGDRRDYLNSTYLPTYGGWIRMPIWGVEITQSTDCDK